MERINFSKYVQHFIDTAPIEEVVMLAVRRERNLRQQEFNVKPIGKE